MTGVDTAIFCKNGMHPVNTDGLAVKQEMITFAAYHEKDLFARFITERCIDCNGPV